MRKVMIL